MRILGIKVTVVKVSSQIDPTMPESICIPAILVSWTVRHPFLLKSVWAGFLSVAVGRALPNTYAVQLPVDIACLSLSRRLDSTQCLRPPALAQYCLDPTHRKSKAPFLLSQLLPLHWEAKDSRNQWSHASSLPDLWWFSFSFFSLSTLTFRSISIRAIQERLGDWWYGPRWHLRATAGFQSWADFQLTPKSSLRTTNSSGSCEIYT